MIASRGRNSAYVLMAVGLVLLFAFVLKKSTLQLARISPTTQAAAVDLTSNLLVHYTLDDNAANTTVADSSGNGHNGTASTNTSSLTTTGQIGGAFVFDGASQYINTGFPWSNSDPDFTVSAWIKWTDGSAFWPILTNYGGQQGSISMNTANNGRIQMQLQDNAGNSTSVTNSVSIANGQWHLITGVLSGTTLTLYVDGLSIGSATQAAFNGSYEDTRGDPFVIAKNGGSIGYFPGSIDDVRIYNRALSAQEVAQLNTDGGGIPPADTIAPTVSMSAPSTSTTTTGVITLSATASDNVGVVGVQFKAGNNLLGSEVTTPASGSATSGTFSTTWDSSLVSNGAYSLVAVARDAGGNYATSTAVSMTVSNALVDRTAPTVGNTTQSSWAAGTTQISMTVSTNEAATCKYSDTSGVAFASMTNTFTTTGGTSHSTTITGLSDGTSYTKYVRCQDGAGNANSSDTSIPFSVRTPVVAPSNAEVIGSEALQTFPDSAEYSGVVSNSPGNGEIVTLNPPRFRWKYTPTPKNLGCYGVMCPAYAPMKFILQVDTNSSFTHPVINVETLSNSYNFLAPLTPGQTYYWRVGYIHPASVSDADLSDSALALDITRNEPGTETDNVNQGSSWTLAANSWASDPYVWSGTRAFTVSSSATTWDRSMLASTSTMNTILGTHPNLLFNTDPASPNNRDTLVSWLDANEQLYLSSNTSNMETYTAGKTWHNTKADATAALSASWWTGHTSPGNAATSLGEAMFVYQMGLSPSASAADKSLSSQILAADPATELVALANDFISKGETGVCGDYGQNETFAIIGYGYDWLYDVMSSGQRAQVLSALEIGIKTRMYSGEAGIFYAPVKAGTFYTCDTTGNYNYGHMALSGGSSLFSSGESHSYLVFAGSISPMLACYADSDACKQYFELAMNYLIGVTYAYSAEGAPNAGGYTTVHTLPTDFGSSLQATMVTDLTIPNSGMQKNPFWKQNAAYWDHYAPVASMSAPLPWSDYANNLAYSVMQSVGWLAAFTQDGALSTHWRNENALRQAQYSASRYIYINQYDFLPFLHAYPMPAGGAQSTYNNVMYPYDGYAMGCSSAPSSASCFQSGLGYVFEARPRGFAGAGNGGHSAFSDLNFELWAYGTSITSGNSTSEGTPTDLTWEYSPMERNTVLVQGLGEMAQMPNPNYPFYNRIYAYKNGPDYTYIAADGTNGYPIGPNVSVDDPHLLYSANGYSRQYYANSPLAGLQKVQRHLLFVKNKYWVVYDDVQSSTPYTYSWLWHIMADPMPNDTTQTSSLSLDSATASFSYTNNIKKFWLAFAALTSVGWRNAPSVTSFLDQTTPPDVKVFVKQIQDPTTLDIHDYTGAARDINPFTGEDYSGSDTLVNGNHLYGIKYNAGLTTLGQNLRSDALWFNTATPQTAYHFMTVIYPKNPQDSTKPDPQIKRIDDWTAEVTDPDGHTDVISFNPSTAPSSTTIMVDLSDLTPLPVVDSYIGNTVTSVPYVPPTNVSNGSTPSAPTISNLSAASITATSTTITWTTSSLTSTQVEYGTTNTYGQQTTLIPTLTTSHSQKISGLTANTTYYYRVTSVDGSSQSVQSTGTFTTAAKTKIMPMGDSITAGFGDSGQGGGYRTYLWRALAASSYAGSVDFVGDQTPSGPSDIDQDNEAHNGYSTINMDQNFMSAVQSLQPDIILIHTGTNDIRGGDGVTVPAGEEGYLKTLLSDIYTRDPNAIVLMAKIIKVAPSGTTYAGMNNTLIDTYNTIVADAVNTRTNQSQDVRIVDLNPALTVDADYAADGMHPSNTGTPVSGDEKMANIWYPAVIQALGGVVPQGGGSTPGPTISSLSAANVTSSGATITWTTSSLTTTQVEYGVTTAYGSQTSKINTLATSHSQALTGLTANTLYYYRVTSIDGSSQSVQSTGTFTTGTNSTPTTQPANNGGGGGGGGYSSGSGGGGGGGSTISTPIAISNLGVAGNVFSGVLVTWTTNVPGTSQVQYGLTTVYGSESALDPKFVTSHAVRLTNLPTNTFLRIQARSKDAYGNLATSSLGIGLVVTPTGAASIAVPSGIASPSTSKPATTISVGSMTAWLVLGATNSQVKSLQQILNASGFTVAASGPGSKGNESTYFGPATLSALQRFQCAKLGVCSGSSYTTGYGATGPKTRAALNAIGGGSASAAPVQTIPTVPVAPARTPVSGSITTWLLLGTTNAQVATLQKILNANGFTVAASGAGSPGRESTYFGPATDAALKKFQCAKLGVCSGAAYTTGYGATGPKTRSALNTQ